MKEHPTSGELLNEATVGPYLVSRGVVPAGRVGPATRLSGGVSNVVLRITTEDGDVVVKQALSRLAVADEWYADPGRAQNEAAALRLLGGISPAHIPPLLDDDPARHALAIQAAPHSWSTWKSRLLHADVEPEVALRLGRLLARWHEATSAIELEKRFHDRAILRQLRLQPYFGTSARRCPDLANPLLRVARQLEQSAECLVLGDFSPKNILVGAQPEQLWVIDLEAAHRGAPSFDVAFMATHLLLKALHMVHTRDRFYACLRAFAAGYGDGPGQGPRPAAVGARGPAAGQGGGIIAGRVPRPPGAGPSPGGGQPPAPGDQRRDGVVGGGGVVGPARIESVDSWQVLDSRGTPTVAARVRLCGGSEGVASVPAGASTGTHEAIEVRDGGEAWGGKAVATAVAAVRGEIAAALAGLDAADLDRLDATLRELDGTAGLSRLGANAVLAVSVAAALAVADLSRAPLWRLYTEQPLLPMPMVNIVSGGAHAGGLVDIQDVLVTPVGAGSFAQALEWAARVRAATARLAAGRGYPASLVADEGGIAGPMGTNRAALELVTAGIDASGLRPGVDVALALDLAASQFQLGDGRYRWAAEDRELSTAELVAEVGRWCREFPVISVEDVVGEDDWDGWREATRVLAGVQLVGDDLFATDAARLARGVEAGVANALLVKPNQSGTLTSTYQVLCAAQQGGYRTVVSARSGETEDCWLSDLAVGWRAGQIKVGSTIRSERSAKWNRLLLIEHDNPTAEFAGWRPC